MTMPDEVDVLVLGAGASGLAAGLTASAQGAETLVIEAALPHRHTPNVRMSGGWVMTLDDERSGAAYLRACAGGLVDDATVNEWARRSTGLADWLSLLGVDLVHEGVHRTPEHPELPGARAVQIRRASTERPSPHPEQPSVWHPEQPAAGGEALYRGLMHAAQDAGIEIEWGARAESLVLGADGGVQGIRLRESGRTVTTRAGVVVATGGFAASPELVRNNMTVPDTRFYGNPLNDGGGLRLAVSAGAETARMNRFAGRGIASLTTAEGVRLGFMLDMAGGGYVVCDKQGLRYTDEYPQAALFHDVCYKMQDFDSVSADFTRSPSYYLFDQRRMDAGPLTFLDRGVCGVGLYEWSADNSVELAAGWIGCGSTPSEAAAAVGAKPSPEFDRSIEAYNAGCTSGLDLLGRRPQTLVALDKPPYYCIPLHVGGPHTTGGPVRDSQGRVLAALNGEPIPGLYGAGELGQAIGLLYPAAGCSLSEALASGITAGEQAARSR